MGLALPYLYLLSYVSFLSVSCLDIWYASIVNSLGMLPMNYFILFTDSGCILKSGVVTMGITSISSSGLYFFCLVLYISFGLTEHV